MLVRAGIGLPIECVGLPAPSVKMSITSASARAIFGPAGVVHVIGGTDGLNRSHHSDRAESRVAISPRQADSGRCEAENGLVSG